MPEQPVRERVRRLTYSLRYWVRHRRTIGQPVTADELMARAKRREPTLTDEELQYIYQKIGNE